MSAAAGGRPRRNGTTVTVAHLDDAIALALEPIKSNMRGVRRELDGLRTSVDAAVERLDRRPVRRFCRWFVNEAHSAYRVGTAAAIGASVAVLVSHLT